MLNGKLRHWLVEVAGRSDPRHDEGATLERFEQAERAALRPCRRSGTTGQLEAGRRVPRRLRRLRGRLLLGAVPLVGQTVWIRGGARTVELFTADHQLVATMIGRASRATA